MPVLRSLPTRIGLTALIAATAILVFSPFVVANASADAIQGSGGPSGEYSFGSSNCTGDKADPVGVLFRGTHAKVGNVANYISDNDYTDWGHTENIDFGEQGLLVHLADDSYGCRVTDAARAEQYGKLPNSRYHVRLWRVPGAEGEGQFKTVGTPHHEEWITHACVLGVCTGDHCVGVVAIGALGQELSGNHAVNEGGKFGNHDHPAGQESGFDKARHKIREKFEARGHKVDPENWGNTTEFEQCDEDWAGSDGAGIQVWINRAVHARTGAVTSTSPTGMKMLGHLVTEESKTEWWFGYGPNPSQGVSGYPNKTEVQTVTGPAELDVSPTVSGLTPNGIYYVRMFARNQDGEVSEGEEVRRAACGWGDFDDAAPGPRALIECNGTRHVFYRTPEGGLQHNWYVPGGSWGHQTLPGSPASEPHPVLAPNGYIHVFYRTPSGGLAQTYYNPGEGNGGWGNPGWAEQILPGSVSGEPHALSDDNGYMYVYYRTPSGGLAQTYYNPGEGNGGWGNPGWAEQILPGSVASEPHPVLGDGVWNNYIYVFYRTPSGGLAQTWYNPGAGNGGWGSPGWGEQILPGSVSGQPHPVSGKGVWDNYFYVFYRTPTGGLSQTWYNPGEGLGGWGSPSWNYQNLPGSPASEPHPTLDKNGFFYVFYRTPSGGLAQTWYNPGAGMGGWGSPGWGEQILPGSVSGEPRPVLNDNGFVYVFYRQPGGGLAQTWYNPGEGNGGWGSPGWGEEALPGLPASEPHPVLDTYGWEGWIYVFYRTPGGGLGLSWYNPGETMGGWGAGGWAPENLEGSVAARPPTASTGAAGGVTTSEAKLAGTANPEGSRTTYYFEYGTTASYGSKQPVSAKDAGNGIDAAAVSETISGLASNTLYHYRLVATSPEGTANGTDKTFVTAASGVAGKLPAMPVTEPFNGDAASLARFSADWSALGWAAGANSKGSNTTTGWRPLDAYPTVNGAFSKSTITDTGAGTAAVATMAANPGSSSRYFSLWLDASGSSSTRSGYELRFTYVSSNTYNVALSKWQSGAQTPLATQSGYSFANSNSLALVDTGAAVSAWSDTGSGFSQLLSAGDSAFSSGNAGLEGAGNGTHLTKFKAGLLPPLGGKFATSSVWGGWSLGYSMSFADVNADGRADIIGRNNGTGEVQVGLSSGSKFNSGSQWAPNWSLGYSMSFADVNADGRADIIGRNNGTGEVQVGLSSGSKFNLSSQWTNWSLAYSMDFADVNKDGKVDLLGRNGSGEVKVGLSTGSSFSSASSWGSWSTAYSVDFVDVHADGRADITGVNSSGDVQVGLSTGSTFAAGSSWTSWPTAYSADFADVNGDGHADIVGRNNGTGEVKVGLSSGVSFNSGAQWAPSWSLGFSMLFADVNADGRADIIGRNQTNGEVQVGLSTGF